MHTYMHTYIYYPSLFYTFPFIYVTFVLQKTHENIFEKQNKTTTTKKKTKKQNKNKNKQIKKKNPQKHIKRKKKEKSLMM